MSWWQGSWFPGVCTKDGLGEHGVMHVQNRYHNFQNTFDRMLRNLGKSTMGCAKSVCVCCNLHRIAKMQRASRSATNFAWIGNFRSWGRALCLLDVLIGPHKCILRWQCHRRLHAASASPAARPGVFPFGGKFKPDASKRDIYMISTCSGLMA